MSTLFLLLACTTPPPPVPSSPVPSPPFALTGRATPDGLSLPSLPTFQPLVADDCSALNAALRADGPPCFVERWSDGRATVFLLRSGGRLSLTPSPGAPVRPRPSSWSTLGDVLSTCLGDPFALPPARDAGGRRDVGLSGITLTLSGANRCRLSGTIFLPFDSDRVDVGGLTVDGRGWFEGGRERAEGWSGVEEG